MASSSGWVQARSNHSSGLTSQARNSQARHTKISFSRHLRATHIAIFYEGVFSKPFPRVATRVANPHSFDADPTQLNSREAELWIRIQHFKGMRITDSGSFHQQAKKNEEKP
jgi:hypothetical protein